MQQRSRPSIPRPRSPAAAIRDGFVTGLVVIAPLAVTVAVVLFVHGQIVSFVRPFLGVVFDGTVGVVEELVAVTVLFALITALGIGFRHGAGQYLVTQFDRVVEVIPLVRTIYSSTRQASNALMGQENRFERVAVVEWPREGTYTIGFVTNETPRRLRSQLPATGGTGEDVWYNVFVAMSPNPMGGFLAVLPESRVTMTDLRVSEGLRMVITTGMSDEEVAAVGVEEGQ